MNVIKKHYNYTGRLDKQVELSEGHEAYKKVVFLVICSFTILENLTVLIAICKNHKFHTRMYFFIANLALCDLLSGVVYCVNILMSGKYTWNLSTGQWFVREGSLIVALSASVFSLLAIAIERHLTMIKMRPYNASKNYRVFLLIGACWLIALAFGALPILGWNCLGNLPDCSTILPLYSKKYIAFCISIFIALLLAISVLYARIYVLVKSSSQKVTKNNPSSHSLSLLRTVVIVVGVFIACWTPLFVLQLVDVACKHKHCPILLQADWFIAVAVLNSAINPVIYTLASREMRQAFYGLLCSCSLKQGDEDGSKTRGSSQSQKPAEEQGTTKTG